MAVQSVDARHVAESAGLYSEMYVGKHSVENRGFGGGIVSQPTSWTNVRAGLLINGVTPTPIANFERAVYASLEVAGQIHTPTRIAPFVGAGVQFGADLARLISDDDDGTPPAARPPLVHASAGHLAIFPEAGVHAWLTESYRLSLSARYLLTASSDVADSWAAGVSFAFIPAPNYVPGRQGFSYRNSATGARFGAKNELGDVPLRADEYGNPIILPTAGKKESELDALIDLLDSQEGSENPDRKTEPQGSDDGVAEVSATLTLMHATDAAFGDFPPAAERESVLEENVPAGIIVKPGRINDETVIDSVEYFRGRSRQGLFRRTVVTVSSPMNLDSAETTKQELAMRLVNRNKAAIEAAVDEIPDLFPTREASGQPDTWEWETPTNAEDETLRPLELPW